MAKHGNGKLTDEDVLALRARLRRGESTVEEEARRYSVGRETIRRANRGETFAHISHATTAAGRQAADDEQARQRAALLAEEVYNRHQRGEMPASVPEPEPFDLAAEQERAKEVARKMRVSPLEGGEGGAGDEVPLKALAQAIEATPQRRAEGMLEEIGKGG